MNNLYDSQTNDDLEENEIYIVTDKVNFKYSVNANLLGNLFHSNYEIFFLLSGNVEYKMGFQTKQLKKYELVIIPPGTYHQFFLLNNSVNYKRCVLEFNKGTINGVNIEECLNGKTDLLCNENSNITKAFYRLLEYSSYRYKDEFPQLINSIFTEILINIKHDTSDETITTYRTSNTTISSILNYIDTNISKPISLEDISREVHFSISSICHIFQKQMHISINQYINQKRLILAKLLLDLGEKPTAICFKIGFSDYSSFYKNFKKYYGYSPSDHKNKKQTDRFL